MEPSLLATILLGSVGILITIYYSWHTKKLLHEQMLKQLFTEFNARYAELNNSLIEIEKKYPTLEQLNNAEDGDKLKQKVIDYFSLCAEEFYWFHHKDRIDKIIWKSWQSGMNYWYNHVPSIKALWEAEVRMNGKHSYYIDSDKEFFQANNS